MPGPSATALVGQENQQDACHELIRASTLPACDIGERFGTADRADLHSRRQCAPVAALATSRVSSIPPIASTPGSNALPSSWNTPCSRVEATPVAPLATAPITDDARTSAPRRDLSFFQGASSCILHEDDRDAPCARAVPPASIITAATIAPVSLFMSWPPRRPRIRPDGSSSSAWDAIRTL